MAVLELVHVPLGCRATKGKNEKLKVYVSVWNVNLFLKGSSENEQMRVCLFAGKMGGVFCMSSLSQRERKSGRLE